MNSGGWSCVQPLPGAITCASTVTRLNCGLCIESLPTRDRKPQDSSFPSPAPKQPTSREAEKIASAYDALAPEYDSQLRPAISLRHQLWERMDALFPAGSCVLDVTAGTGLDVLHLIERGAHVIAAAISPHMLAQLKLKAPGVETRILAFNPLGTVRFTPTLNGIISTFAGLNTSPDLRSFTASAARLLDRNAVLFIHTLTPWPVREIGGSLIHLKWSEGWSKLTRPDRAVALGDRSIRHYLYSPVALYRRVFSADFRLQRVEGQGLFTEPAADNRSWLRGWETTLSGRCPFHSL